MFSLKKNPILYGTLILSFSGLICRAIGFFYRLFISQAFGEEAMGIFQLTSPVIMLAFSLTSAGMQTAISRYTAANYKTAGRYLFAGMFISLLLSVIYSILIYCQADWISLHLLKERRCAPLLRICALAFPFSALHCCFNGYFYGKKETKLPSFCQLTEQLIRVLSVFLLYYCMTGKGQTPSIALTCVGMFLGEVLSFLISITAYLKTAIASDDKNCRTSLCSRHRLSDSIPNFASPSYTRTLLDLCSLFVPLTLNRVIVNLLQSYEAVSIPTALRAFGYSQKAALSIYGVLTGMALSLILFPSTFTNSAAVLLLPTVSEAVSKDNMVHIRKTILQSVFYSLVLGCSCTFFFFFGGDFLGTLLFDSTLAGSMITSLSFLCPFLYLHTTLSSILNGLKKTTATLLINVVSLLIHLGFILILIPRIGVSGFIWGILCGEIFSSICSLLALRRFIL